MEGITKGDNKRLWAKNVDFQNFGYISSPTFQNKKDISFGSNRNFEQGEIVIKRKALQFSHKVFFVIQMLSLCL